MLHWGTSFVIYVTNEPVPLETYRRKVDVLHHEFVSLQMVYFLLTSLQSDKREWR